MRGPHEGPGERAAAQHGAANWRDRAGVLAQLAVAIVLGAANLSEAEHSSFIAGRCSGRWPLTPTALRDARADWRRAQAAPPAPQDGETTLVLAHWVFAGTGLSAGETWLAASLEPAPGSEGEPTWTTAATKLMTVPQVLDELGGVSRRTFYRWRELGFGPAAFKLPNGELRVWRSDFTTWLRQLEAAA